MTEFLWFCAGVATGLLGLLCLCGVTITVTKTEEHSPKRRGVTIDHRRDPSDAFLLRWKTQRDHDAIMKEYEAHREKLLEEYRASQRRSGEPA